MNKFQEEFDAKAEEINAIAHEHGFWDGYSDGEKIALMHLELSETLEALRHNNPADEHCPNFDSAAVELADCIIRIMDFAFEKKLDVSGAILAKCDFNKTRPYKHNKKF